MAQFPEITFAKERKNRAKGFHRRRNKNKGSTPVVERKDKGDPVNVENCYKMADNAIHHLRIILGHNKQGSVSALKQAELYEELVDEANYGAITISKCTTLVQGHVYIIRYARVIANVENIGRWHHVVQRCKHYQKLGFTCAIFSSYL